MVICLEATSYIHTQHPRQMMKHLIISSNKDFITFQGAGLRVQSDLLKVLSRSELNSVAL